MSQKISEFTTQEDAATFATNTPGASLPWPHVTSVWVESLRRYQDRVLAWRVRHPATW